MREAHFSTQHIHLWCGEAAQTASERLRERRGSDMLSYYGEARSCQNLK
jgi:hypothetical protein